MATPPPRFSTPSGSSRAPRSAHQTQRSASYAPAGSAPSTAAPSARSELLSPVSKYNRSLELAREEQEARMKAIAEERARRVATKQSTVRLSSGSQSSVKRKLTELETAAAAAKKPALEKDVVRKSRASTPGRSAVSATTTASMSRRVTTHGGVSTVTAASATTATTSSSMWSVSLSASALKRHDEHQQIKSERLSAGAAPDSHERYLAYEQQVRHLQQPPASTPQSHRSSAGAQGLFARHNDPTVMKTPPSTTSSPFKFPDYESSVSSAHGSPAPTLRTPTRQSNAPSPIQEVPRGEDGMVDLEHVSTVSQLETLEGDDILSALMSHSTPRIDRHFPSEHSRTDSEEREIQFLRRRRLAASTARKSLDRNAPIVTAEMVGRPPRAKWSFDDVLQPINSPSTGAVRRGVISKEAQQARDDAENAKAEAAENEALIDEEDDDDDDVTTETKVAQFSNAHRWGLRRFIFWVIAGASIICALDVAFPLLVSLFEPPLPFCDNNASLLGEMGGEATALALVGEKSDFTALQTYRTDCRACPLFGVCSNGTLVSCLPPLEERQGACVESKEVQYALEQIAKSIQNYITDKATNQVCGGTPQLPFRWDGNSANWGLEDFSTARVAVLLSELKEVVLKSPFAETLMNISLAAVSGNAAAGYVFNRSMDLAMSSFQKITQIDFQHLGKLVGSNEPKERGDMLIQFSTSIVPWSCRARNQLLTHAHIIGIAVAIFAVSTLLYRKWLLYKTKRALVDRLVKEVRYFLLGRSHRTERFYPANHLRDNLFDTLPNVSPRDGKWLRESVWPTVAAIVAEDSRVRSHIAPIHGKQMVVWEWISSNSPNVKATEKKATRLRSRRNRYSI